MVKPVTILQEEIVQRIVVKMAIERSEVYKRDLLDFEPQFEKVGWNIDYDRPGYNESYEPTFTFSAK